MPNNIVIIPVTSNAVVNLVIGQTLDQVNNETYYPSENLIIFPIFSAFQ